MSAGYMDHVFGAGPAFSVGVEEELFLVDPLTGRQTNASKAVLERVSPVQGRVERELHACQVELITDICADAGEAVASLAALRKEVLSSGAGLLGSGTHPAAPEGSAEITDRERYERIHHLLGDAVATPVGGLHIHVGMPDPETAIRTFNGLRSHLPLLQGLAANSPFRHGRNTGLASAREVTIRGWPRSGLPRAMKDFRDFSETALRLARAASVPDYTWFWWKMRPHPRLGTVEIRALDAQTSLEDVASLVALTQCLAYHEAGSESSIDFPGEILEEAAFRAARFGVQAQLPDRHGRLRPLTEVLSEALSLSEPHAQRFGCQAELARLWRMVEMGGPAGRQRSIYEIAGLDALQRQLTASTGEGA